MSHSLNPIPINTKRLPPTTALTFGQSAADNPSNLAGIPTYDLIRAEDYLSDLAAALRKLIRKRVETMGGF